MTDPNKRITDALAVGRKLDEAKFRELVIYIAQKSSDDPEFGPIKLNKVLYHADFIAYGQFGHPITSMEYVKLEHGPGPQGFVHLRNKMVEAGEIGIEKRPAGSKPPERVVALREPDLSSFTGPEVALIDRVIEVLRPYNAYEVSEVTHGYIGWRVAQKLGDPIPYGAVFFSPEAPTEYERQRAHQLIQQHGWNV